MNILSSNKLGLKCDSEQVEDELGRQWNCHCQSFFFFSAPDNILPSSLVEPDEALVIQRLTLSGFLL